MKRLDNIQRRDLTANDFREHLVWVWSDDMEAHCPLSGHEIVPEEYGTYFIAATLSTVDKLKFDGYMIGDGKSFYAFGLFVRGEELVLNMNLPDLMKKCVDRIRRLLGRPAIELFPVTYESPVTLAGGQTIRGTLSGR
jgi:hypothetical protein